MWWALKTSWSRVFNFCSSRRKAGGQAFWVRPATIVIKGWWGAKLVYNNPWVGGEVIKKAHWVQSMMEQNTFSSKCFHELWTSVISLWLIVHFFLLVCVLKNRTERERIICQVYHWVIYSLKQSQLVEIIDWLTITIVITITEMGLCIGKNLTNNMYRTEDTIQCIVIL